MVITEDGFQWGIYEQDSQLKSFIPFLFIWWPLARYADASLVSFKMIPLVEMANTLHIHPITVIISKILEETFVDVNGK